ncbi:MAG: 16S rRNA (guanine(527)-N(7))-methyltransferase RsmG [Eubacteriales bacterium]
MHKMQILEKALDSMEIKYTEEQINKFAIYMELVLKWNESVNLTSIKDEDEFILKHFVDSIMCAREDLFKDAKKIVDIGTGAGFPGIPLAILFPHKKFTLVDSLSKKINIIKDIVEKLELKNVILVHSRAEDFGRNKRDREAYDLCVSRAVAKLAVLSEYCIPLVRQGGYFIAYKGSDIDEELRESLKAIEEMGGKVAAVVDFLNSQEQKEEINHKLIIIEKVSPTPDTYPRKAGLPQKEPIKNQLA